MLHEFACELCCQPKVADQLAINPTRRAYAAEKAIQTAVAFRQAAEAAGSADDSPCDTALLDRAERYLVALFDRHFQPGMQVSPENLVKRAMTLAQSVHGAVTVAEQAWENAQSAAEEAAHEAAAAEAEEAEKLAEEAKAKAEAARKRAAPRSAAKTEATTGPQGDGDSGAGRNGVGDGQGDGEPAPGSGEPLTLEAVKAMAVADLAIDAVTKSRLVTNELRTVGEAMAFRKSREFTEIEGIGKERAERLDAALEELSSRVQ